MEENCNGTDLEFLSALIELPELQGKIVEFATSILGHALKDPVIRGQVLAAFSESEILRFFEESMRAQSVEYSNESNKLLGRQKITAKDAARILCYNPHYFSRKAKGWGLTKIRMSRTSCRYFLDEVEQLAADRGIREVV